MSRSSQSCNFSYSDGRRCRMSRSSRHPSLCHYHARIEQHYLEAQQLGAEISTTLTGHFHSAADINHVLGKVFTALAQGRIPRRTAATLMWGCQLMLQSLPALKDETKFRYTYETWSRLINRARPLSPPPQDLPAPSGTGKSAAPPHPDALRSADLQHSASVSLSGVPPSNTSSSARPSQTLPQVNTFLHSLEISLNSPRQDPQPVSSHQKRRYLTRAERQAREKAEREAEYRRTFKPDSAFLQMSPHSAPPAADQDRAAQEPDAPQALSAPQAPSPSQEPSAETESELVTTP